ncbi:MAG: metal ABC transporter substrate-binding protein [Thermoleophilia bacterium]
MRRTRTGGGIAAAALVVAVLAATGCGGTDDEGAASTAGTGAAASPLRVTAAFYPLEEAARQVGGDRVRVTDLTPPGAEPHDLEPTPEAVAALEDADVVLYLGDGFQPSVEKAVANLGDGHRAVDLLAGLRLRKPDSEVPGVRGESESEVLADDSDPHVWVDPRNFETIVRRVRDALVAADPAGRAAYDAGAARYLRTLGELDASFASGLRACRGRALVTSHAAFGYLADRYGLVQAPIAGIDPEQEPDPRSLAATAAFAKAHGVTTVFFESLVPKDLARTVADEIGARTDALDPVEGIPQDRLDRGASYVSIQRDNLRRLERGLGC